ncbi:MAG: hypothetical protein U5K76_04110 [Woeseiaceae bacterium]|nr:hypothetical protein [Woeseiaceae bacterium]
MINHRIVRAVLAFLVGLSLAVYAYHRATDPEPRRQRMQEETVVREARDILQRYLAVGSTLEIVDPLATDRAVGKVYIYPVEGGWQVSGHYRRAETDDWHPWLMRLDTERRLQSLAVRDDNPAVAALAAGDDRFTVDP